MKKCLENIVVENRHKCLTLNFHAKNRYIEPLDFDVFVNSFEATGCHWRPLESTVWGYLRPFDTLRDYLRLFEVTWGYLRSLEASDNWGKFCQWKHSSVFSNDMRLFCVIFKLCVLNHEMFDLYCIWNNRLCMKSLGFFPL